MRSYCPARFGLAWLGILGWAVLACVGAEDTPEPAATPDATQSLGIEIAEAYGQLLEDARVIVEPRPPAPEAKERLRLLGEEYKVQFASYACLRDDLSQAEQVAVMTAFDANRDRYLPADMAWFEDAAEDYDLEDPVIRERLEAIETLDEYAFMERLAVSHPGEELLCG